MPRTCSQALDQLVVAHLVRLARRGHGAVERLGRQVANRQHLGLRQSRRTQQLGRRRQHLFRSREAHATIPRRVRMRCVFSGNSAFTRPVIVAATLPFNCW